MYWRGIQYVLYFPDWYLTWINIYSILIINYGLKNVDNYKNRILIILLFSKYNVNNITSSFYIVYKLNV